MLAFYINICYKMMDMVVTRYSEEHHINISCLYLLLSWLFFPQCCFTIEQDTTDEAERSNDRELDGDRDAV
jgi:hypothetical protein